MDLKDKKKRNVDFKSESHFLYYVFLSSKYLRAENENNKKIKRIS